MSEIKIDLPTYWVTIPSSQKQLLVRPFTRKEEKLLLIAAESKDQKTVVETVKQVINNCIVEGDGPLDLDKMPFFDVDFLFIFLRAKSIGETVELKLTCNNEVEGKLCGHTMPVTVDISNAKVVKDETIDKDIKLSQKFGVLMKYPTYALMKTLDDIDPLDQKTEIIVNSIEYVYDTDGKITKIGPEFSKKQMADLVDGLTEENYKKLERFVDNFPVFVVTLEKKCEKCGFEHKIDYSDFYDFFFY